MQIRQDGDDGLVIAIVWREDVENKSCTYVVCALAEAGIQMLIPDQVKASHVQLYDSDMFYSLSICTM